MRCWRNLISGSIGQDFLVFNLIFMKRGKFTFSYFQLDDSYNESRRRIFNEFQNSFAVGFSLALINLEWRRKFIEFQLFRIPSAFDISK